MTSTLVKRRPVIKLAQLKNRTKEQKLADLASYDFHTTEELPLRSSIHCTEIENERTLWKSVIADEKKRPTQFKQNAEGDT